MPGSVDLDWRPSGQIKGWVSPEGLVEGWSNHTFAALPLGFHLAQPPVGACQEDLPRWRIEPGIADHRVATVGYRHGGTFR